MKTLKELLTIIIDSLTNDTCTGNRTGICAELRVLQIISKITVDEADKLNTFIYFNKPDVNQHNEFTRNECWIGEDYWWKSMKVSSESRQIRIDFLTKLKNELCEV